MGCDIHIAFEQQCSAGVYRVVGRVDDRQHLLQYRDYRVFSFLAGVRNNQRIKPISAPRGFPFYASIEAVKACNARPGAHTTSWLNVDELLSFDYSRWMEADHSACCMTRHGSVCDCHPILDFNCTYREYLSGPGSYFFEALTRVKQDCIDRIVFWFDN